MIVQHDDNSLSDEAIKALRDLQENQGGYFLFNTRGRTSDHNPNWESSRGFFLGQISLGMPSCLPIREKRFIFTTKLPDMWQRPQWNLPSLDFKGQDRHDDGTEVFLQLGQRS